MTRQIYEATVVVPPYWLSFFITVGPFGRRRWASTKPYGWNTKNSILGRFGGITEAECDKIRPSHRTVTVLSLCNFDMRSDWELDKASAVIPISNERTTSSTTEKGLIERTLYEVLMVSGEVFSICCVATLTQHSYMTTTGANSSFDSLHSERRLDS